MSIIVGVLVRAMMRENCTMLTLLMAGDFAGHEGGTVHYLEVRTDKDTEEFVAGEALVLPIRVGGFPLSHPLVAFEDDAGVHGNHDAVVAKFAEEASITVVDGSRYGAKIVDVVVKGIAVDMVDGIPFGDQAFEGQVL